MSNRISIKLSENYIISDVIRELTVNEWEFIFGFLTELIFSKEKNFSKITEQDFKNNLSKKYNFVINDLNKQIESKNAEIIDVQTKLTSLNNGFIEQLNNKLNDQRNKLHEFYTRERENDIKIYKDRLTSLREEIEDEYNTKVNGEVVIIKKELEYYKLQTKELQSEKKQIEQQIYNQRTSIRKEIEEEISNVIKTLYEEKINSLNIQLESKNNIINTLRNNTELFNGINEIKLSLEPLNKMYNGTNNEKGVLGENVIKNFLENESRYETAKISDTSGQAHLGDIHFEWKKLKCLIEVKNKKQLKIEDMDKFINDIKFSYGCGKINSALFISLHTSNFPNRSKEVMQLDFCNTLPIIYLHLVHMSDLHYALLCLENLIKIDTSQSDENKLLLNHFKDYYNLLNTLRDKSTKLITTKQKELLQEQKHLTLLNNLCESTTIDYKKLVSYASGENSTENNSENSENYIEHNSEYNLENSAERNDYVDHTENSTEQKMTTLNDSKEEIKFDWKTPENTTKQLIKYVIYRLSNDKPTSLKELCNDLSISSTQLNKIISYKELINAAKYHYTSTIIKDDIVTYCLKYKETNGKFPTRQHVINNKIITDNQLRKLNKVIKSKKLLEYIYKYCENKTQESDDSSSETEK